MEMRVSQITGIEKLSDFLEKVGQNNTKGILTFVKGQGKVAIYIDEGGMSSVIADVAVEGIPTLQDMITTSKELAVDKTKICTGIFHYILTEGGYSGHYKEVESLPPLLSDPWNVDFQLVMMNLVKEYDENAEILESLKGKRIKVKVKKIPDSSVEFTISEKQWPVFASLCEGDYKRCLFATGDIENNASTLSLLKMSGLIELVEEEGVGEEEGKPLPKEFEEELTDFLVEATGPFGELLIEEAKQAAGIEVVTTNNWLTFADELKSRIDEDCRFKGRPCREVVDIIIRKYI